MEWITIVGISASICTAVASVPQLIKILKEKKADDISLIMILVLVVGLGIWVYYGVLKEDYIIVIANSIPCLVNMMIGVMTIIYSKK
ncbi:MAG: SemiSWEET transporter [Saprospiraceae bacterium]